MKWIREEVLEGKLLAGTFLGLGSSITAEIAARSGFDWLLIDLEHGAGDRQELLVQLQAIEGTPATPIVRIRWNETQTFKRILDLGPSGIMVPFISTPDQAREAVAAMQYPPDGVRGVAILTRASGFGQSFAEYFEQANKQLLVVGQIESAAGVKNAAEIAAVDRVDVLFVGPMDLSVSLGIPRQFDHPDFREALTRVVAACKKNGKAAGILAASPEQLGRFVELGFTFVACGSDAGSVANGLRNIAAAFDEFKKP